jgi:hypothetical protein
VRWRAAAIESFADQAAELDGSRVSTDGTGDA